MDLIGRKEQVMHLRNMVMMGKEFAFALSSLFVGDCLVLMSLYQRLTIILNDPDRAGSKQHI